MKTLALIPAYTPADDRLLSALGANGVPFHVHRRCSDLPKARSQLLTLGLEQSDAERFLLADADMVPTEAQVAALLESEMFDERDAVTGAYALRDGRCAFLPEDIDAPVELGKAGFVPLQAAGLGFALVHRKSLEAIAERLPRVTNAGAPWWPFCVPFWRNAATVDTLPPVETAEYVPEDYALWQRHRWAGGRLWLATDLLVGHEVTQARAPLPGAVTRG